MSLDITLKTKQDSLCFNITHNLTKMASAAKIYSILWRPQEAGIKKAGQLIEPLEVGIKRMKAKPAVFIPLGDAAGWGTYDQFIPWLEKVLAACKKYPRRAVEVSV